MRDVEPRLRATLSVLTLALALSSACVDTDLSDELNWGAGQGPGSPVPPDGDAAPPDGSWPSFDGGWRPPEEGGPVDTTPPWIVPGGACAMTELPVGELCVSVSPWSVAVRLWASEAVVAAARLEPDAIVARAETPAEEHHLLLLPLAPDTTASLTVDVEDRAGLTAGTGPHEVHTAAPRPTVVLNEVLCDPLGDEPHQEVVELHNFGPDPVLLDGWSLADEGGEDLLVAPSPIPGGGFAIVVSDRYVPGAGGDPPPAPGALVIRLDGPIGSAGLRNSGEMLTLRDDAGTIVSTYPALTSPPGPGISVERVCPMGPDGDPLNWSAHAGGGSTPGGPNAASGRADGLNRGE